MLVGLTHAGICCRTADSGGALIFALASIAVLECCLLQLTMSEDLMKIQLPLAELTPVQLHLSCGNWLFGGGSCIYEDAWGGHWDFMWQGDLDCG